MITHRPGSPEPAEVGSEMLVPVYADNAEAAFAKVRDVIGYDCEVRRAL